MHLLPHPGELQEAGKQPTHKHTARTSNHQGALQHEAMDDDCKRHAANHPPIGHLGWMVPPLVYPRVCSVSPVISMHLACKTRLTSMPSGRRTGHRSCTALHKLFSMLHRSPAVIRNHTVTLLPSRRPHHSAQQILKRSHRQRVGLTALRSQPRNVAGDRRPPTQRSPTQKVA